MVAKLKKVLELLKKAIDWLRSKRNKLNRSMSKTYSGLRFAIITTAICALVSILILFVPRYLGVANDSIGNLKMQEYGLAYLEKDTLGESGFASSGFASNEYFTRVYQYTGITNYTVSASTFLYRVAKSIDNLFTGDRLFDVRFLAGVYMLLYIPVVFLAMSSTLGKIKNFSEAVVICLLGVLIFSDLSYITYMNSLYDAAIVFICMMAIYGAMYGLRRDSSRKDVMYLGILFVASALLTFTEKRFFLIGIIISAYIILMFMQFKEMRTRIFAGSLVAMLIAGSVLSVEFCHDTFDETAKYHSMTRGVLLNSNNPVKTLQSMGIESSYSVLAGSSLYDYYPVAEISNELLHEDFMDLYSNGDIVLYYMKTPTQLVSMWNLGVKAGIAQTRSYCGNYERSANMPPEAKSAIWAAWTMFRQRSLPSTLGYLVVMIILYIALSIKKAIGKKRERDAFAFLMCMIVTTVIGIADLTYIIVRSGDSQLVQFQTTMCIVLDLILFGCVTESLIKLNILEEKNENQR